MGDPGGSSVHVSVPLGSDAPKKKWPNYAIKSADSDGTEEPLTGDKDPPLNNTEAGVIKAAFDGDSAKPAPACEVKKSFIARAVNAVKAAIRKATSEPRRVSTVAVTHGSKLLMGKRRDNGKWTTPGGHVDPGEDHHAGALRELKEESGLDADELMPLSNVIEKTDSAGKPLHVQVFHHALDGDRPPTTMQEDPNGEVERWHWVNIADGLPDHVKDDLHVPLECNALMGALGLDDGEYNDHPDEIEKGGYADPATADDAEPLDGYDDGGSVPIDELSAINALGYAWTDGPATSALNRAAGYPSQGGASVEKGGPGSTRWGGGSGGGGGKYPNNNPSGTAGGHKEDGNTKDFGAGSNNPPVTPERKKELIDRLGDARKITGDKKPENFGPLIRTGDGQNVDPTAVDVHLHDRLANVHDDAATVARGEGRIADANHHARMKDFHNDKAEKAQAKLPKNNAERSPNTISSADKYVRALEVSTSPSGKYFTLKKPETKKSAFETLVPISKADKKRQIVYCVVLAPDDVDLQTDIMHAEDIEETAHNYLKDSRVIGDNHSEPLKAYPVESYIAPCDFEITDGEYGSQKVKQGSWVIGIKIVDPKAWAKVEAGDYQGVSVGGYGLRDEIT